MVNRDKGDYARVRPSLTVGIRCSERERGTKSRRERERESERDALRDR